MKNILLILLLGIIAGQSQNFDVFNQTVSEEYCNNVIGNMTALLKEGYIYLDFVKAPKQPEGKEDYIPKVDLVKELKDINKTNRTFFDFYADIQNVLEKTRDGHFSITTSGKMDINYHFYCLPFKVYVKEVFDETNKVNDTYLALQESISSCPYDYPDEILNKIKELDGKKILQINGKDPYEYLEEFGKKGNVVHSSQCRYMYTTRYYFNYLPLRIFPYKKEDLTTTIKVEGEEQEFTIDYQLVGMKFFSEEFKQYYIKEQEKYLKLKVPFPPIDEIELKFKIKKGLINEKLLREGDDIWELKSSDVQ